MLEPVPQVDLVVDGYDPETRSKTSHAIQDNIWKTWLNNLREKIVDTGRLELIASGAVKKDIKCLELNHTTVTIAATIADSRDHKQLSIKATTEPGVGQDHTVTLTAGTWNGTATIATFQDINDYLLVEFDSNGNGTVILNSGVTLS